MGNKFTKDPDAIKDYHFDWRQWLAGDSIDSYTLTASPGLTVNSHSAVGGGTDGTTATVQCRIITAAGRREDDLMHFSIRNKA